MRGAAAATCGLSVLWLGFTLGLDLRYDMWPRTVTGGVKILGAAWILLAFLVTAAYATRYLGEHLFRGQQGTGREG